MTEKRRWKKVLAKLGYVGAVGIVIVWWYLFIFKLRWAGAIFALIGSVVLYFVHPWMLDYTQARRIEEDEDMDQRRK